MVLKLKLEKEFEQRFREMAMRKYGFSRGAIKKASTDAVKNWMKEQYKPESTNFDDLLNSLRGVMKHLKGKYTSVELQHETAKLWAKEK
ncbi:hypothetical protein HZA97_08335 [Candidatus Woesearchaeota archaeon]|nr:hypothetical protein [Candidatus Woesearchaeota archaeon]